MQMYRNCADIKIEPRVGDSDPPVATSPAANAPVATPPADNIFDEEEEEEEPLKLLEKPAAPAPAPQPLNEEEAEILEDVSAAGNDLKCEDELVQSALRQINCNRGRRGFNPLKCSDRSTGAAANWAELMCSECALSLLVSHL